MVCLAARPVVDGLERDVASFARVVRLNLQDAVGQRVAAERQVRLVPTFLVLDGQGRERARHQGLPNGQRLERALRDAAG